MNFLVRFLVIGAIAGVLFFPFLGQVHLFDWDEINFAESAREMVLTGDYMTVCIDYVPFWEKPPLFIWMQVLSMKVFGINEYAARFPDALCGVISIMFLFYAGRRWKNEQFGLIWAIVYMASVLPFIYFKSGIIDPWFNLFIFLALFFIMEHKRRQRDAGTGWVIGAGLFLGLAVLTKGPVAIIIFTATFLIFWLLNRFRGWWKFNDLVLFLITLIIVGGSWFFMMMLTGHTDTLVDFIEYQVRLFSTHEAGHSGSLFYHVFVLFLGLFPASLFFISSFFKKESDPAQRELNLWMKILFWVVLVLFSIVQTKIVHYSSLCYFPMTFLAATFIQDKLRNHVPIPKISKILIVVFFSLFMMVIFLLPLINTWKFYLIPYIKDPFALDSLNARVHWSILDILPGLILLTGILLMLFLKRKSTTQWISLAVIMILFIISSLWIYPRKVEMYSQNALINICKSMKGKKAYFNVQYFNSYAHLFYSEKQPGGADNNYIWNFLELELMDHPIYLVTKKGRETEILERFPFFRVVIDRNGYVLLFQDKIKGIAPSVIK
jgi:4-amino-4-deoxy-L-arabinose transferase-like glycosyltransferase